MRKKVNILSFLLTVLLVFESFLMQPVNANSGNCNCPSPDDLKKLKAEIDIQSTSWEIDYDWSIEKTVDPVSLTLEQGKSGTVQYTLEVTRNISDERATVTGEVYLSYSIDFPYADLIFEMVSVKVQSAGDDGSVDQTLDLTPVENGVSFEIEFTPLDDVVDYLVVANISSLQLGEKEFKLNNATTQDETAIVTDSNNKDVDELSGFTFELKDTGNLEWEVSGNKTIQYRYTITNDSAVQGTTSEFINTAIIVGKDTEEPYDESSATVDLIAKDKEDDNGNDPDPGDNNDGKDDPGDDPKDGKKPPKKDKSDDPKDQAESPELTTLCTVDPQETRKWEIFNPNDEDLEITWSVVETDFESEPVTIPAKESITIETKTEGEEIITLQVNYGEDHELSVTQENSGVQCESPPQEDPKDGETPPPAEPPQEGTPDSTESPQSPPSEPPADELPNTANPWYNVIFTSGLLLIASGSILWRLRKTHDTSV